MNKATSTTSGFQCPVRGCTKKHNRFFSYLGLTMHMVQKHSGEFEKRLKLKKHKNTRQ
jgi:hypothetical protein